MKLYEYRLDKKYIKRFRVCECYGGKIISASKSMLPDNKNKDCLLIWEIPWGENNDK
jgi:hypothetical protein